MPKRQELELFVDSILDHANSLQSLQVVKSNVESQIIEVSIKKKSLDQKRLI